MTNDEGNAMVGYRADLIESLLILNFLTAEDAELKTGREIPESCIWIFNDDPH